MANYNQQVIEEYFDQFAGKEWDRLVRTPIEEIKLAVHAHYLRSYVPPGSRVLEVGAGPGRFTQILAAGGCKVTVTDLSQVQLDLNKANAEELGFAQSVESWRRVDICDMSAFPDNEFDVIVCYGGPLSYVLDQRERALSECLRVIVDGGLILASVMSLWGTVHAHLPAVLDTPPLSNRLIVDTGDVVPANLPGNRHDCHLYRSAELRAFLERHYVEILAMSASNTLATAWDKELAEIRQSPERWAELVAMEIEACREPGCLDIGTHMIAVGRKVAPTV